MGEDLKFVSSAGAFDPETVTLLSDAFEQAWRKTQTSDFRFARPAYTDLMRAVMVKHLLNLADHGERDQIKLSNSAFHFFAANYRACAASPDGHGKSE
jgi:hypothetical protein